MIWTVKQLQNVQTDRLFSICALNPLLVARGNDYRKYVPINRILRSVFHFHTEELKQLTTTTREDTEMLHKLTDKYKNGGKNNSVQNQRIGEKMGVDRHRSKKNKVICKI